MRLGNAIAAAALRAQACQQHLRRFAHMIPAQFLIEAVKVCAQSFRAAAWGMQILREQVGLFQRAFVQYLQDILHVMAWVSAQSAPAQSAPERRRMAWAALARLSFKARCENRAMAVALIGLAAKRWLGAARSRPE